MVYRNPAWTLKLYASCLAALTVLSVAALNGEGLVKGFDGKKVRESGDPFWGRGICFLVSYFPVCNRDRGSCVS